MTSYAEIKNNLVEFKGRILNLEKKFENVDRFISKKELQWHSDMSEIKRKLRHLNNVLQDIKKTEEERKKDFINIVENFKIRATKDEYRKLETKIDHWDISSFITKDEFENLLNL